MRSVVATTDYATYVEAWDRVTRRGYQQFNVDTWAGGHRYLSLVAIALTSREAEQLQRVTVQFSRVMDHAVDGILEDPDWWTSLAWPWAAIELARQEPPHPDGLVTLYGRFDCLLDSHDQWQIIEFNADTPSGGRERTGLEPEIVRLYPNLDAFNESLAATLVKTIENRIGAHPRPVKLVGVVSSHRWIEDLAQARWLAALLCRSGQPALVGDVNDLTIEGGHVWLRGRRIDALYRFYPIERLYRHAIFAGLFEAAIDGRLLILNGLRGFLAQSKACLAWLWTNRCTLAADDRSLIEQHLPPTLLARDPEAASMLAEGVVKHVNGREGDSVVFGDTLDAAGWEARLLEGGYVVQRAVRSPALEDVDIDDLRRELRTLPDRYACVGAFAVGGRFAGCYTRLDGPITSSRATYSITLISGGSKD